MPKVKITRDIVVKANDVATILYAAREAPYERVPTAHAALIVANGAGERIAEDAPESGPVPPAGPPGEAAP
ncbi:hypothetical protein [Methylobacterium aerolatum]|uniref:Uncharacterized protein n=1 Tax=Methylobacterium aerolatum TaxID=418708 RepID=A0ABU0I2L6_9HYPH|nr:hypothetical protein [Methylobacterium aerolatum]MDQ0448851.1 hypothetical protein [Methylobacterium aerolatum]GJD34215.1 hypothetical protein FMGBMHLM_1111 [Methylobacterium aerolatum]